MGTAWSGRCARCRVGGLPWRPGGYREAASNWRPSEGRSQKSHVQDATCIAATLPEPLAHQDSTDSVRDLKQLAALGSKFADVWDEPKAVVL